MTGLLLSQPVIAGVSGGIGIDRNEAAWNSVMGFLVNWEASTSGRGAGVEAAESTLRRSTAAADLTELQVGTAAAEAFLNVVATEQTMRAAAAVERARVFRDVVTARVTAGLRPSVDAEPARAELALAENQRIVAEQNARIARVILAQYTGRDADLLTVDPGPLLTTPAWPQAWSQPAAVRRRRSRGAANPPGCGGTERGGRRKPRPAEGARALVLPALQRDVRCLRARLRRPPRWPDPARLRRALPSTFAVRLTTRCML